MTACRACKSTRVYLFLALGNHPLANGFVAEQELAQPEPTFPLDVHVCLDCGLIQVADNIPAEFFRHYVYIPSASEVMREHFAAFASTLAADGPAASDGALAVDIGCNDGTLLEGLKDQGVRTLGVDPATNIVAMAREKGLEVVNEYFTPDLARQIRDEHGPAAVIVTTNTFHHIGDLDTFTEGVTLLLDDDGVFVVEVPYALDIIEAGQFDGVYHEHVSQFTVKAFVDLFARFGMEVLDVQFLDVHAGSLRVFAGKAAAVGRGRSSVAEWVDREAQRGLFSAATYDAFSDRVRRNREALLELLGSLKQAGARIVGYGASARGNTLLNYYGIGPETLDYIVDRNELKHGLYTPGMNIPVCGVERLLEDMPQYVLVIAWNFAAEIVRQQATYAARGGKFLLPIPEVRVLESAGV